MTDPDSGRPASYAPADHYDRVTAAWKLLLGDELHYGVFNDPGDALATATGELTRRMIEALAPEAGMTMLDVGCGVGAPACRLAAEHGLSVTGITTSREGIAEATARAAALGLSDRARFEERDGMDNGLPDASFDRAWALESSHLMRDRDALVRECARVLRPGGRLAICDIILRREMPYSEVKRLREPLALLREVYGDAQMRPLDEYAEMATRHGLVVDVHEDLTAPTHPTFACWRRNAAEHHDELVELLGEHDLERFVASCDVLEGFWDDGTLGYGLLAAARPA